MNDRRLVLLRDELEDTRQRPGATTMLEIDHILPIARRGTNDPANLQVLCRPCNRKKWAH